MPSSSARRTWVIPWAPKTPDRCLIQPTVSVFTFRFQSVCIAAWLLCLPIELQPHS